VFVRWDNLRTEQDQAARLPVIGDAVVRTFDAPEALGIRFHEIKARSALNRVPPSSRMPFRWTVNPYRGCSHACTYCARGETPILMGDGRTKPLGEIRVGDRIYGTEQRNGHRRYVLTTVEAHWSTSKPGHRLTLEDGTELVTSPDHRFLTAEGWKHVSANGRLDRPRLGIGDRLAGVGREGGATSDSEVVTDPQLTIVSAEALEKTLPLYDITTGTGDFIANGVVSHNCFARPTHTYLNLNAGRDFEREIVVKVNVPELLRAELGRRSWQHEHVALGTNTDPYQWVESRYRLMPEIWAALRDSGTAASLVTKSPLVLRDVDVLRELHEASEMSVYLSVPTIDEGAWRETEPHTPSPRARLEAVRKLNEAGVPAGILIAPLMPGINDAPEQVEEIVRIAEEAGAISIGSVALHLRGEVRDIFFGWLRAHRPDLIPRYEEIYSRGAYARTDERRRLTELVKGSRRRFNPKPSRKSRRGRLAGAGDQSGPPSPPERDRQPKQTTLF
jgi:DNA repair photolyase